MQYKKHSAFCVNDSLAGSINAFGVTVFLAPVKLYDSGISGTSMLLSQITPEYLSLLQKNRMN
uniref:YitT family protein n=1 Tax=Agathobacter sp. TaxID=2021311 RepID=UPI004057B544